MNEVLDDTQRAFVLASGSPRRLELMRGLGFRPVVHVSQIPEEPRSEESPREYTERLAQAKARAVAEMLRESPDEPAWVLAADTVVVHDEQILEKPGDRDEALSMLRALSGTEHTVLTSFCWLQRHRWCSDRDPSSEWLQTVSAEVEFADLSQDTLERYVDSGEPYDKAGGYGIQDLASALVVGLRGSYFAVVGLPVHEVVEALRALGALPGFPFRRTED